MNGTAATLSLREQITAKLSTLSDGEKSHLQLLMENPAQDENLIEALHHHLDLASKARLLNSLKLERLGEWLGTNAPARLQIRLTETSRSSQHSVYQAFRAGLVRSGGLEKAYPKA